MKSLSEKYNYWCVEREENEWLVLEHVWLELARVEREFHGSA